MGRLYTVKGRRTIAKGLTAEAAAEVAIDAGGHLTIVDESTGSVAIEDTDGDYMTIGATESLLAEYERNPGKSKTAPQARPSEPKQAPKPKAAPKPVEPEPEPESTRPRFMAAPKRRRR